MNPNPSTVAISKAARNASREVMEHDIRVNPLDENDLTKLIQSAIDAETAELQSVVAFKSNLIVQMGETAGALMEQVEQYRGDSLKLKTLAPKLADCTSALERAEKSWRYENNLATERHAQIVALETEAKELRAALEAFSVFVTPLEHLKNWNDYKEDAAQRRADVLARFPAR